MQQYSLNQKFLFRTPTFPFNKYLTQLREIESHSDQVLYLKEMCQHVHFQEAVFIASPSLYEQMTSWSNGEELSAKKEKKLVFSLTRYLLRMSARCTPFGLFAGCTLGEWGTQHHIQLNSINKIQRRTRPDMNFLCNLAQDLSIHPDIQPWLQFFPNNSIYKVGEKIRYVEYLYKNKKRVHQITSIDGSIYLSKIITAAKNGARLAHLADQIVDEEIDLDEAMAFIAELVSAQVLVSELDGNITGEEMLDRLIDCLSRLNSSPHIKEKLEILQTLKKSLNEIDKNPGYFNHQAYLKIETLLKPLGIPFERNELFQLDYYRTASFNQLDKRFAGTVRRGVEALSKLSYPTQTLKLKKFAARFIARYETKEIPLNIALDVELGLGYSELDKKIGSHPLIVNIGGGVQMASPEAAPNLGTLDKFLVDKLLSAYKDELYEVELFDDELKQFPANFQNLPDSINVLGLVCQWSPEQKHPLLLLENATGSAPFITGRFTTLHPEIEYWVKDIAQKEQSIYSEDIILAEVVHLPQSRTGNVLMRKTIRPYEIPYLAKSSVPQDFQLPLDDLMVSVINNEVILRSKRLNKRVLPRMANAHNYNYNALPIYEFLCDLQSQNTRRGVTFNWGTYSSLFKFFPRVKYHNTLLSPAMWSFSKEDFKPLLVAKEDKIRETVEIWQEKWKLPSLFLLAEGDHQLLVDLENTIVLKTFINAIKTKNHISLREFLFNTQDAIIKDEEGYSYTNEIFFVFNREELRPSSLAPKHIPLESSIRRSFSVGSEWLYYKIYCGHDTADELLVKVFLPLLKELSTQKDIEKWFFVRYEDPDFHLRIRMNIQKIESIANVISKFTPDLSKLEHDNFIWKVQLDSYERELERYGNSYMNLCEYIFWQDSKTTLAFLAENIDEDVNEDIYLNRCIYGLLSMNVYISVFQLSTRECLHFLDQQSQKFLNEIHLTSAQVMAMTDILSEFKDILQTFIFENKPINNDLKSVGLCIQNKSDSIKPYVNDLISQIEQKSTISELLESLIHMMVNRLFSVHQRAYEAVLYTFLLNLYKKNSNP